jgi:heme/copper-type cytochrome/quinol oxidase subunit 2
MNPQKNYVGIIFAIILVIIIGGFLWMRTSSNGVVPSGIKPTVSDALDTVAGGTRTVTKEIIATPDANSAPVSKEVAIPTEVVPTGGIATRKFTIRGEGNAFVPSTIVVNELDIVELRLEAIDGTYDIFFPDFGVSIKADKGGSGSAQFQATQFGQYGYVCKSCTGQVKGTFIVNKK